MILPLTEHGEETRVTRMSVLSHIIRCRVPVNRFAIFDLFHGFLVFVSLHFYIHAGVHCVLM